MTQKKETEKSTDTIQRSMLVNRADWVEAKVRATRLGLSMSDVMRDLIGMWLAGKVKLTTEQTKEDK